jgi:glutamate racemase
VKQNTARPIGIFDSGIGGLTVVRQIRRALPHEHLVYLGDTARVPYGTKSPSTVIRFACEDTQFLADQGVKAVVVACNTASAWAIPELEGRFEIPVFGVIDPGAAVAVAQTRSRRIGVIGTAATIRSEAYVRAIHARDVRAKVFSRACPLLVPLVEEGWTNRAVTRMVLRAYLSPLIRRGIDTLVLGCTHYPLLKPAIRAVIGRSVSLVDSAESCAKFLAAVLESKHLRSQNGRRSGCIRPFVTDEVAKFALLSRRFLGAVTIQKPNHVQLPTLPTSGCGTINR